MTMSECTKVIELRKGTPYLPTAPVFTPNSSGLPDTIEKTWVARANGKRVQLKEETAVYPFNLVIDTARYWREGKPHTSHACHMVWGFRDGLVILRKVMNVSSAGILTIHQHPFLGVRDGRLVGNKVDGYRLSDYMAESMEELSSWLEKFEADQMSKQQLV